MNATKHISDFLNCLSDANVIVDKYSNIVFANSHFFRLFGFNRNEVLGKKLDVIVPSHFAQQYHKKVYDFISNKYQGRNMSSSGTILCVRSNGEFFRARISIANIIFDGINCAIVTIFDVTSTEKLIEDLHVKAFKDPLTGLFNRHELDRIINKSSDLLFSSSSYMVTYLDLDDFKVVNDTYGHNVGDLVLKGFSSRLVESVRECDMCFRVGGDEFIILFKLVDSYREEFQIDAIRSKITNILSKPFSIDGLSSELKVDYCMGVAVYPKHSFNLNEVIKKADKDMYKIKFKEK
ncbi:PAS domain S-box-containing protein/diguanylate cyclase (GGDEF)-like protein [Vibrio crassostreae]|uniref:sensor domain-containing diguanylate cyclase n=1 Tax=Vibrio crassostreae TaxID=246167 RepID=UPI001047EB99|nr:sensor domain-containing diguanylate cyclase [Vibrio crassostreae]TCN78584.1 PAS domain S-box-containing protein/diguanylate cyclase (GGDEF)-like protein [Vibrio crassostreae]